MDLTLAEYQERLRNLAQVNFLQTFDAATLVNSAEMVEVIADDIQKTLEKLPDTDLVFQLRDDAINLGCLGRFLSIALIKVFEEPNGSQN